MKHRSPLVIFGAFGLFIIVALVIWQRPAARLPLTFSSPQRRVVDGDELLVFVTNNMSIQLRCSGNLAVQQGANEIARPFDFKVGPKRISTISVTTLKGDGEIRVCCRLVAATGQHPAWIRRADGLITRAGIYIYHMTPKANAPI